MNAPPIDVFFGYCFRANGGQRLRIYRFSPDGQDQNMVLTVLCVMLARQQRATSEEAPGVNVPPIDFLSGYPYLCPLEFAVRLQVDDFLLRTREIQFWPPLFEQTGCKCPPPRHSHRVSLI